MPFGVYTVVSRQCKKDRATLKADIKNVNLRLKKEKNYNGKQKFRNSKKRKK